MIQRICCLFDESHETTTFAIMPLYITTETCMILHAPEIKIQHGNIPSHDSAM